MRRIFLVWSWMLLSGLASAAPFQNLGFDDANTNNLSSLGRDSWGRPEDLLPGWQLAPLFPVAAIGLNVQLGGGGYSTLWSDQGGFPPVEGRFSFDMFQNGAGQWTLSQTGTIPEEARAVHFLSYDAHVTLSLDGVDLPLVYVPRSVSGSPGAVREINDVYGDVSAFGGKTVDLTFTTLIDPNTVIEPDAGLDSISFIIPEPATWVLLSLGCLCLIKARTHHRRDRHPSGSQSRVV